MPDKPCSCSEIIERVVVLETDLAAYKEIMFERDARYQLRANAQDHTVRSALETSEKAIEKAEIANEKRFDSVNEFRATLADQATRLMPRAEYDVQHKALEEKVISAETALEAKVQSLENRFNLMQQSVTSILARGGGLKDAWGYLVAILSVVLAALTIYFRH